MIKDILIVQLDGRTCLDDALSNHRSVILVLSGELVAFFQLDVLAMDTLTDFRAVTLPHYSDAHRKSTVGRVQA
jgi:hypothetical protein